MGKRTLSVTVNGKTYTRNTNRAYTHIVFTEGMASVNGGLPFCVTGVAAWCGSEELAQKRAKVEAAYLHCSARILPVDQ